MMSVVIPTFESVFTKEYWSPVSGATEELVYTSPTRKTLHQLNPLLTEAARNIFQGVDGTPIEPGASLSPQSGEVHTLPGSILLADIETIKRISGLLPSKLDHGIIKGHETEERYLQKHTPLRKRAWITDDPELQANARSLFLKNSKNHLETPRRSGYIDVGQYNKILLDPDEPNIYRRVIGLMAVAPDKNGLDRVYMMPRWGAGIEDAAVVGTTSIWEPGERKRFIYQNLLVKQTIEINEKGSVVGMIRVRHAELCTQGLLSRVTQKQGFSRLRINTKPVIAGV